MDALEKHPVRLQDATLTEDELDAYEPDRLNVKTLLNQPGYFRTLFANMPYDLTARAPEQVCQAIMVPVLWFIGVGCETEIHTSDGAIDAVFKTDRDIYVAEFNRGEPAAAAMAQIRAKDYAAAH